jgi:L-2-hydroxyglutarate oxidase
VIKRIAIIGGGIVGLATAWRILNRFPNHRITVLEKEPSVAQHQTGRNSGVIHSGIYYKPGSLKAINCCTGKDALINFCHDHGINFKITGKVIVATREEERKQLHILHERGRANGVPVDIVDRETLLKIEPHVAGIEGLHVKSTGIIDYRSVAQKLSDLLSQSGHQVLTDFKVTRIQVKPNETMISAGNGDSVVADLVVNCAGLACDRIALLMGDDPGMRIIPFRGEYFQLNPNKSYLCQTLIYPVPNPAFPFLGVHLTKMIDGSVECGPNAVLAFAREGYFKTQFSLRDMSETFSYPGFQRLATRYWKTGLAEMYRSLSKSAFTRALQRLVPEIQSQDLTPAPAGIRAQAVLANGDLMDDFLIKETASAIHVLNAPSPAATSCLSIGEHITERIALRV